MTAAMLFSILETGAAFAALVLIAALGELVVERAGLVNIGIEGMMLGGAFAAFLASYAMQTPWPGLLAGMLAGVALSVVFAFLTIRLAADQIVAGLGINLLAVGLTGFFHSALSKGQGLTAPYLQRFPSVLVALALAGGVWWLLWRSWWGLSVRAVGEHPRAADTLGIPVHKTQVLCVLFGGAMAGLAGALLSIGVVNSFAPQMTDGRGFIALALVVFGRWRPWGVVAGAAVFGMAQSAGVWIKTSQDLTGGHQSLVEMIPYLLTILILAGAIGNARPPAHLAIPYTRE